MSVASSGIRLYAVSNDEAIYRAAFSNHGHSWTCSAPMSTTGQAIFPWIVATSAGADLVDYGAVSTGAGPTQLAGAPGRADLGSAGRPSSQLTAAGPSYSAHMPGIGRNSWTSIVPPCAVCG